jgi:hypothetical protein
MFDLCRRGFLKLATTFVGGIAVAQYVQPEMVLPELHPWVTDMGNFYYVKIPAGRTFSNEKLDKPCVFLFGERSTACNLEINGFVDAHFPQGMFFKDNTIDASRYLIDGRTDAIELFGSNSGGVITRNRFIGGAHA